MIVNRVFWCCDQHLLLNCDIKIKFEGAMCVATGWACAGVFTHSKSLAEKLISAGEETGDRIWRMPVFKSHKSKIAPAPLADLNNTGPRYGGACNAAAFLRSFVPSD
jgi:leucyl aminopeptidase